MASSQLSLWTPPARDMIRDPHPGDELDMTLLDDAGNPAPYHVQILEIFRYTTGPRVRISVLDRQFQQSTEILTALQWWEGAGLQVPSLLWQDGGEGWTLFVGERSGFVKTMGEAARLIWG